LLLHQVCYNVNTNDQWILLTNTRNYFSPKRKHFWRSKS